MHTHSLTHAHTHTCTHIYSVLTYIFGKKHMSGSPLRQKRREQRSAHTLTDTHTHTHTCKQCQLAFLKKYDIPLKKYVTIASAHTHALSLSLSLTHTHTYKYMQTVLTCIFEKKKIHFTIASACVHTYIHVCVYVCMYIYIHSCICIQTFMNYVEFYNALQHPAVLCHIPLKKYVTIVYAHTHALSLSRSHTHTQIHIHANSADLHFFWLKKHVTIASSQFDRRSSPQHSTIHCNT